MFLFAALALCAKRKPVTEFLSSELPCSLCVSLAKAAKKSDATNLIKVCKALPKTEEQAVCAVVVEQHFDELKSNDKYCWDSGFCKAGMLGTDARYEAVTKTARKARKPQMKPLGYLDCPVCQTLISFLLENSVDSIVTPFHTNFQETCKSLTQFKDNCGIFTPEVMAKMADYIAKGTDPYHFCMMFSQCP